MKSVAVALALLLPCVAATPDTNKDKVLGGAGAPLVIEVYSSFACSHCKDFHEKLLPQIVRDYVVPGKACVISREYFPPNSAPALDAARIATAAAHIGKYRQVADALFNRQAEWAFGGQPWAIAAGTLTPDEKKKVETLAKDPAIMTEIQHDLDQGAAAGLSSTPTLVISRNGKKYPYSGVPEYSLLRSLFDSLLAQ
jgi:protein-disulfide isomerase